MLFTSIRPVEEPLQICRADGEVTLRQLQIADHGCRYRKGKIVKADINRILIESTVRNTLKGLRESPERSIRNLVDMACRFSGGEVQQRFFRIAQQILKNQDSAYYAWIRNQARNSDLDRLTVFGMDLGYNSCTLGTKMIREEKKRTRQPISWACMLRMEDGAEACKKRVEEEKKKGVYTYYLEAGEQVGEAFSVLGAHEDCAFFLFCDSDSLTERLLDKAVMKNFIFVLEEGKDCGVTCRSLKERGFLYAMIYTYREADEIVNGTLTTRAAQYQPAGVIFRAEQDCPRSEQERVLAYVIKEREDLTLPVIPFEMAADTRYVDEKVSESVTE